MNRTLVEHDVAAASEPEQPVIVVKELALAPAMDTARLLSALVPLFVIVKTGSVELVVPTGVDGNVALAGDRVTVAVALAPVPERLADCEPVPALSVITSVEVRVPAAAGANAIVTTQEEPVARAVVVEQVVEVPDPLKSPKFPPLMEMLEMLTGAVPVFLTVTVFPALVEPTTVEANVRLVGVSVTAAVPDVDTQLFTRLFAFTEPRPVARSKPEVETLPVMIPTVSPV